MKTATPLPVHVDRLTRKPFAMYWHWRIQSEEGNDGEVHVVVPVHGERYNEAEDRATFVAHAMNTHERLVAFAKDVASVPYNPLGYADMQGKIKAAVALLEEIGEVA